MKLNYVCQILNLFEMAIRLRKEVSFSPEVFGSWVIWTFGLANAVSEKSDEVQYDYTFELRQIMNVGFSRGNRMMKKPASINFASVARGLKCRRSANGPRGRKEEKRPRIRIRKTAGGRAFPGSRGIAGVPMASGGRAGPFYGREHRSCVYFAR